jgi:hypothetical protein
MMLDAAPTTDASGPDAAAPDCDPLDTNSCPPNQMCSFFATSLSTSSDGISVEGFTTCVTAGVVDGDAVCRWDNVGQTGFVSTCVDGLICPHNVDNTRCVAVCRLEGDALCEAAGGECIAHGGGLFSDHPEVGLCVVP